MIRPATTQDAQFIADIYNHYVANSVVTFEQQAIDADEVVNRLQEANSSKLPYLVAANDCAIVGYAYASKWKGRCSYRFSVEVTVYLAPDATGQRFGTRLYQVLFAELRRCGFHIALAGIALPNEASIALHERFGMEKVAHLKEVGFKFGHWVDVGYWQVQLD